MYEASKQREEIEMMIDRYKTFMQAEVIYMRDRHVLEGWLFVSFIAMLGYYKLYERIRKGKLLSKEPPKDNIEQSKSIYQERIQRENGSAVK
jgi:hypothetical protein